MMLNQSAEERYYPPEVVAQRQQLYSQLPGSSMFGDISLPTLVFSGLVALIVIAAVMDR